MRSLVGVLLAWLGVAAAQETTGIQRAEQLGRLIYEQDTAAWVATDAMFADEAYFTSIKDDLRGWVTTKREEQFLTAFVGGPPGAPYSLLDVRTKGRDVVTVTQQAETRPLDPDEAQSWRDRQAALETPVIGCPEFGSPNVLAFPDPDRPGETLVYYFSASSEPGVLVFGRHYRFTVSDGVVVDQHDFAKSCLAVPAGGPNAVGAVATHLTAPYPEEHHVFVSLSRDVPVYVRTTQDAGTWRVVGGRIEAM